MERRNLLSFKGSGGALFGLTIVNTILTIITLGLYYPWAKVKYLQYYYQNMYLSGDHFSFHGTGIQMFKGFIKAFVFIAALIIIYAIFIAIKIPFVGILIYILGFLVLAPIAMHGTYRYRLAKTSWRSIHFGYRGNLTDLIMLYLKGLGLTIITFTIYSFWFEINLKKYVYKHIRFGNVKFSFTGNGTEYFLINLKGIILTIITLGIYSFWYTAELYRYHYKNIEAEHNGQTYRFDAKFSAGKVFMLYFINGLIVTFTLGLGFAWAKVREMRFLADNIIIPEELDTDNIVQTEEDYKDATGEGMLDFLDFDIIF